MWKHNIILTFRNFKRNQTSFFINLIGFSTSLACILVIYFWVTDEVSIDKFHKKDNHLFKVMQNFESNGEVETMEISPILLANALTEEIPEVQAGVSISSKEENPSVIFTFGDKNVESNGIFASENFFNVFSFPLIEGNHSTAVNEKSKVAISESLAKKLFSDSENIIGSSISFSQGNYSKSFKVSGIFQDPPKNSTIQFDFVMNINYLIDLDEWAGKWNGSYAQTFVVLNEGVDLQQFNQRIEKFLPTKDERLSRSNLFAQKFSSKYLFSHYENGKMAGGRIEYVRLFSLIAIFILLIACINFMNLSTAQASTKLKEVGIKKTIGANRSSLIRQFLTESLLLVFISLGIALILVLFLLPTFNQATNKTLTFNLDLPFIGVLLVVLLLTGLIAGSYPAFYLSKFKPSAILKGTQFNSFGETWIRKGLVVFQFTLSLIFIVGVMVVQQQMNFIQTKNLGFDRENIISFQRPIARNPEIFLEKIKKIPDVVNVTYMADNIFSGSITQGGFSWTGNEEEKDYLFKSPIIGFELLETMNMEITQGRAFSKERNDNRSKIIINESALEMMQLENPIGKNIIYGDTLKEIIGVVKDFNYGSIHTMVQPLIFRLSLRGNNILVKLKSGNEAASIAQFEEVFHQFYPNNTFTYSFMDEDYQSLYEAEGRVAILSKYFSGLAIILSCLGLLGLAIFTTQRRKKEIGIRKVLGSSIFGIVRMLTSDFTRTVFVAILIALPIGIWGANQWLTNFAYKIDLSIGLFLFPAALVLLIAWLTVGVQTIRAAQVNPVESLKND